MNILLIFIFLFTGSNQFDRQELGSFLKNATNQLKNNNKQTNPWDFLKEKLGKDVLGSFQNKFSGENKTNQKNEEDFIETFFNTITKYDKTIESDLTEYPAEENQLITIIQTIPLVCKFTDNQHQLTRLIQKFTSIYKSKQNTSERDLSDLLEEIKQFLDDFPELTQEQKTFRKFIYLTLNNLASLRHIISFKEIIINNNQDENQIVSNYMHSIQTKNKITAVVESSLIKQYKSNQMNLPILCAMFSKIIIILQQQREQFQLCNAYEQLLFYEEQTHNYDDVYIYKQSIFQSMKAKHDPQKIKQLSNEMNQLIQTMITQKNISFNATDQFEQDEQLIALESNHSFYEESLLLKNEEEILQTSEDYNLAEDNNDLTTKDFLILVGICISLLFVFIFALVYLIKMKPQVQYMQQPQKNNKNKLQIVESCAEIHDNLYIQ